jgi:hypothetical protein
MEEEQLRQAIRKRAVAGKVACKAMLELARQTEASPQEIGKLCNVMRIRIAACQLGCFK